MGNSLSGRKTAKVMKIDGETIKLKTPVQASHVIKDYPDHVLMDSEAVRHLGVRAKALDPSHELQPKRLYFLVQLPAVGGEKAPRRARSGVINMSAKDRLESLMLARRSVSDLSLMKTAGTGTGTGTGTGGARQVKMRLPKAQVAKLIEESKDETEAAEKMMRLCAANEGGVPLPQQNQRKPALRRINEGCKHHEVVVLTFIPHINFLGYIQLCCNYLVYLQSLKSTGST